MYRALSVGLLVGAVAVFAALPALKADDKPEATSFMGKISKIDTTKRTLFIGGEVVIVQQGNKIVQAGTVRLVASKSPRVIDVVVKAGEHEDSTMLGIYELKGDDFKFYVVPRVVDPEVKQPKRPKSFDDKAVGVQLFVLKRKKP